MQALLTIPFKKLHQNARVPRCEHYGEDAGYDLFALESTTIKPFERKVIQTGIAVAIPKGYYGRVAPRSGLAVNKGLDVLAGVIDSGYRKGIGVVLINFEAWPLLLGLATNPAETINGVFGMPGTVVINEGDKIAQLIIEKCHDVSFEEVSSLDDSARGENGFGSTN